MRRKEKHRTIGRKLNFRLTGIRGCGYGAEMNTAEKEIADWLMKAIKDAGLNPREAIENYLTFLRCVEARVAIDKS